MHNSSTQTRFQSPRITAAMFSGLAKHKLTPQTLENNKSCLLGNMARKRPNFTSVQILIREISLSDFADNKASN